MAFLLILGLLLLAVCISIRLLLGRRAPGGIAFFHPYCGSGGGGERVLWQAICALQGDNRFGRRNFRYIIYTSDANEHNEEAIEKVSKTFGIDIPRDSVRFVRLRTVWLLEPKYYPYFTLLLQMLGGFVMGLEALWRYAPEIFMDTTGCSMTLPVFKWLGGCKVAAYIHYPMITSDMIRLVADRTATYNNSPAIARSWILSRAKVLYYKGLACLYWLCGRSTELTMVNSEWTAAHISQLWGRNGWRPVIVYPPCSVQEFTETANKGDKALATGLVPILSVGQIRPEKNHEEQLRILQSLKQRLAEENGLEHLKPKLVIAGGCRGAEDARRVDALQQYARDDLSLGEEDVEWHLNIPFQQLLSLYETSLIGLHAMLNEHFGIAIVEGLAAGLIMVAHNSGGPKTDILEAHDTAENSCGFLADNTSDYVDRIVDILRMDSQTRQSIRDEARQSIQRFDAEKFRRIFCDTLFNYFMHGVSDSGT